MTRRSTVLVACLGGMVALALAGLFGNHRVDAGPGNDYVRGGAANDVIDCGPGRDTMNVRRGGRDRVRNCERRTRDGADEARTTR